MKVDPKGLSEGEYRVGRGGSWYYAAADCRVAYRDRYSPGVRSKYLGFRLALSVPARKSRDEGQS